MARPITRLATISVRRWLWANPIRVVLVAIWALACTSDPGYKGRSSTDWIGQLEHGAPDARVDAAFALGHVLELQPNVRGIARALINAVRDTNDDVRIAAAIALRRAGARARGAVPGVAGMLTDTAHASVRRTAALLLGDLGRYDPVDAAAGLERAMSDRDVGVRLAVIAALAQLGSEAGNATSRLIAGIADPDARVRAQVIDALARVGTPHDTVTAVLRRTLSDTVASVRIAAIQAIARSVSDPAELAPVLRAVAADAQPLVRLAVVNALSVTSDTAARTLLLRAARDSDPVVQREASHMLSRAHQPGDSHPLGEPSPAERCVYGGRSTDRC